MMLIGRHRERDILDQTLRSGQAELVAVYGRRRVGKTFLVREHLGPKADVFLTVTGQKDTPAPVQLATFQREIERALFRGAPLPRLSSWREALNTLATGLETLAAASRKKQPRVVVFLDELPWLATPRSGLLQALDHTWNTRLSLLPSLTLVVCGSAASWMLDKLIHAKGGLHNRITRRLHLQPFTLREARAFLEAGGLRPGPLEVVDLYLAVGGIPHYLGQMQRGRSAQENIAHACFSEHGILRDELERLFASLFVNAAEHETIVRALARRRSGATRSEIIELTKTSSGGRLAARLRELEEAGFIASMPPYAARTKNTQYRLIDEYCWFYLKWIERAPKGIFRGGGVNHWLSKSRTPGFVSWAGFAFEGVCMKHAVDIQRAMGIESIPCEIASWRHVPRKGGDATAGAQVDMLFDRDDGVIHLCELKYAREPYVVTKKYAGELRTKLEVFEAVTRTRKKVVLTLVSPFGLAPNVWSEGLIERVVTLEALLGSA